MLFGVRTKWRAVQQALAIARSPFIQFAPPGHFYSPLPTLEDASRSWIPQEESRTTELAGFDAQRAGQLAFLESFPGGFPAPPWPEKSGGEFRYHADNGFFGRQDAVVLSAILAHFQPGKVIEVGSGFSSAAMVDIRNRGLCRSALTFIEPFPERLDSLLQHEPRTTVLRQPVQQVPLAVFSELAARDVLFVDSSHVVKIGSDLHHLLFQVLPVLQPGVVIHFHDIFWPFEYPEAWYRVGRAWNEAYFLRLLLSYSQQFRIVCFNSYLNACAEPKMRACLGEGVPLDSGGLWLQKI
jgi:hypothetical protein